MKKLPFSAIRGYILGLALLLLAAGIGYRLGERRVFTSQVAPSVINVTNKDVPPQQGDIDFSLFWNVWGRMFRDFFDAKSLDPQKMLYGAISGMVASADDPYTSFFPPKENQAFKEDIGGSFSGIGAQLGLKDGRIIIISPLKGSPAEASGIKPGDYILKVNTEETYGWTVDQAVTKIRGPKGTEVTLSVLHEKATKPLDITITRDDIVIPSVVSWVKPVSAIEEISSLTVPFSKSTKIGYLELSRFGDRTEDEWDKAVNDIASSYARGEIRGLVFDLRNNPGGYLELAVSLASEFLKKGIVVTQANSDGSKEPYPVRSGGRLTDIPLVVLINKGSASAAEITAGAIKDNKRAKLVGETSFGKGSVQTPEELPGGASIHITTGKWLTPSGEWIHKKGIIPDVVVAMDVDTEASKDAQLAKAIEVLLK